MAESDVTRKPTATTEELNQNEIKVKLLVDGIIPPTFGSKKKPKNGELTVTFSNTSFELLAKVNKSGGQQSKWHFQVKKLPSEIITNRSTWKVEKGLVVVSLWKKDEVSWAPMLRRGLEQADSSDEEED